MYELYMNEPLYWLYRAKDAHASLENAIKQYRKNHPNGV